MHEGGETFVENLGFGDIRVAGKIILKWILNKLDVRVRVRVRVTLRLAVYSQLVRLGDKPFETHDQHFFNRTLVVIVLI
jgi:hypothetical protein